jgi:hypothetical protein
MFKNNRLTPFAAALAAAALLAPPAFAADPAAPASSAAPASTAPSAVPEVISPCAYITDTLHSQPYCSDASKQVTFALPANSADNWTFSYSGGGSVIIFTAHFESVQPLDLPSVGLNIWDVATPTTPLETATPLTNGRSDDARTLQVNYSSATPGDVMLQLFNGSPSAAQVTFSQSGLGLGPSVPPLTLKIAPSSGPGTPPPPRAPAKVIAIADADGKLTKGQGVQGTIVGTAGGGQETTTLTSQLTFKGDGKLATVSFNYSPLYTASKWGIGFSVYGPNGLADYVDATHTGNGVDYVQTVAGETYTVKAFNYILPATVQYTLSLS